MFSISPLTGWNKDAFASIPDEICSVFLTTKRITGGEIMENNRNQHNNQQNNQQNQQNNQQNQQNNQQSNKQNQQNNQQSNKQNQQNNYNR